MHRLVYTEPSGFDLVTPLRNSGQETETLERYDETGAKLRQLNSCISLPFPSNVLDRLHLATQTEVNAFLDRVVEFEGAIDMHSDLIARY